MRLLFSILLVTIAAIREIPYDIRKAYERRQICLPLGASYVSRAIFTAVFRSRRVINTIFVAASCWNAWMVGDAPLKLKQLRDGKRSRLSLKMCLKGNVCAIL